MKLSLVFAALLLVALAGSAHALTLQSADGSSAGAAALTDPDDALQKKFDSHEGSSSFSSGSGIGGSGFSFGVTSSTRQRQDGSGFDRMMPWASQPGAASAPAGTWR